MKVYIASDHAGVELKTKFLSALAELGQNNVVDFGPLSEESVDYPDYADKVCSALSADLDKDSENPNLGILICGSGQGMSMRANKYKKIRAALCWNSEMASLAKQHNRANVLCLGARMLEEKQNIEILKTFFSTEFEGGRHQRRVDKLMSSTC